MKIWKLLVHRAVVISFSLFIFCLKAYALPLADSEKSLIIESSSAGFKPCLSKFGFWACPDSFTIPNMGNIDIRIQAVNGGFTNVRLTNVPVCASVSPPSCPTVSAGEVCVINIENFCAPPETVTVNVRGSNGGNDRVFTSFTLILQ